MLKKDKDIPENVHFLSTGATVTVQQEYGGPWMNRTIVSYWNEYHCGITYKV